MPTATAPWDGSATPLGVMRKLQVQQLCLAVAPHSVGQAAHTKGESAETTPCGCVKRAASVTKYRRVVFDLFFKNPLCYLAESIQPYSYWKLILGASFKGLLLDFLIKIQTLRGQSCSTATGTDRQTRCEHCAAQQPQANLPRSTVLLYQQQQDQLPGQGAKGQNTVVH